MKIVPNFGNLVVQDYTSGFNGGRFDIKKSPKHAGKKPKLPPINNINEMKKTHASFLSVLKSDDNESPAGVCLPIVPVVSLEYVNSDNHPVMSVWGTTLANQTPRQTRQQVKSKSTTRSHGRVDDCSNLVSLRGKGYEISLQQMKIADDSDENDR
ncbi:hypothetical protein SNE40_004890 [Patella caerulea]|uniref:Uncharacterized protein n=1 Tax=Patella caerulea TaxID=87958 RepID=A0AAN8K9T7_PATCE